MTLRRICSTISEKHEKSMNKFAPVSSEISNLVRYKGDKLITTEEIRFPDFTSVIDHSLRNGLSVSKATTPILEDVLSDVCHNISFNRAQVNVFVFASPEIQALCQTISEDNCVIQLSSGLVNLLSTDELAFVIGHELGHHILEHYYSHFLEDSLELNMQKRAQEISVDRFGLIACSKINVAVMAMIKTVSGLQSEHLHKDIRGFLDQIKSLKRPLNGENQLSTHPSLLMRCRALVWFSQAYVEANSGMELFGQRLRQIDSRVEGELAKFVEGPTLRYVQQMEQNLGMWLFVQKALEKGKFQKDDQAFITKAHGKENLDKIIRLIESNDRVFVIKFIDKKISGITANLKKVAPSTFDETYASLEAIACKTATSKSD